MVRQAEIIVGGKVDQLASIDFAPPAGEPTSRPSSPQQALLGKRFQLFGYPRKGGGHATPMSKKRGTDQVNVMR
jgi:hypothetical protein